MTLEERNEIRARSHAALIAEALEMLDSAEAKPLGHLERGLKLYLTDRIETGGFLRCVLENDLQRAIGHAHPTLTMAQMKTLVMVLSSSFPTQSWGSPEKVAAWLQEDPKEGEA